MLPVSLNPGKKHAPPRKINLWPYMETNEHNIFIGFFYLDSSSSYLCDLKRVSLLCSTLTPPWPTLTPTLTPALPYR